MSAGKENQVNEQLQSISEEQKNTWNKVSDAWKKWNEFTMDFLKPMGDAIIKALKIKASDLVLDIASGTGEPAFSIAAMAKKGRVYAVDLSEEMLTIARNHAIRHSINNIEFKTADVSKLPFDNNFFDAISCRMGFMFFPDMQLAANEMFRVCRTGGRMAISVWGEKENNDWYTTILDVLSKHVDIPRSPSGGPGMFRCSKRGLMKTLFESAGFKNVTAETISGKLDFKTAENYWLNRTEISEQIVNLLSNLHESTRDKIKAELFEVCKGKMTNGNLIMDYASLVISAEK